MKVMAISGHKGGGGRSTICIHLAVEAARLGERVLAVDMDPSRSLSHWYKRRRGRLPSQALVHVYSTVAEQASEVLAFAEQHYDRIFLDMPRLWSGKVAVDVLKHADFTLVPLQASIEDLETAPATLATLVGSSAAHAFILNAVEPRSAMRALEALQVLDLLGAMASPHVVCKRTELIDAAACGRGVAEYAPNGAGAREFAAIWEWAKNQLAAKDGGLVHCL